MLLTFIASLIMSVGLVLTLFPRYPGTVVVFAGAVLYGSFTEFRSFAPWLVETLVALIIIAEVGGRCLRLYLTRSFTLSRRFAVDSIVGNIGGVIVSNALLGPILGVVVWELVSAKTLEPRLTMIGKILGRLAGVAMLRLACGIVMSLLIGFYIF